MRAVWNGAVLAQSDATVVVEGNHYFPPEALNTEYFTASSTTSVCYWKGKASYYDVTVGGATNTDAAWTYPRPAEAAREIAGYVAFWRGVKVEADPEPAA